MSNTKWYPQKMQKKVADGMERNLDKVAEFLKGDIQQSFGTDASGTVYYDGRRHRMVNAAAKGYPPNVQTGDMKRSIRWERTKKLGRRIGSAIGPQGGSAHSYPYWLEIMGWSWLRAALDRNRKKINKFLGRKVL